MNKNKIKILEKLSINVKKDILKIAFNAGVGHIGSSFSIVEILTVLYGHVMKINPEIPNYTGRDIFILSKGHAAAALYSVLHRVGFISRKDLLTYCKNGGIIGTHPVKDLTRGIELSTGSLGHGLSVGVGIALGFRMNKLKQNIYVLISDAELNEGSTWEAVMFASHHKLNNLIVIIDDNSFQAFGRTESVIDLRPLENKWKEFGWFTQVVDGHSVIDLISAFNQSSIITNMPSVIIAKTLTAHGIKHLENKQEAHYNPLTPEQYKLVLSEIK